MELKDSTSNRQVRSGSKGEKLNASIRFPRYRKLVRSAGFQASMSRKGNCYDNAPMESFFHTIKTELVHHRRYATREDASRDIFAYIEGSYNRTRRHSAIGYISPIEMELKAA
jgi:putative transposase